MTTTSEVELNHTFPALDSLRLVGALCVLTTHVGFQTGEYLRNGTFGVFLARLDVGVAIFFVLSGFLLSRSYFARVALDLPRPRVLGYYAKRVLRIMPVYVVTVVAAFLFVEQKVPVDAKQWVSSLLMLDVYHLDALPQGLAHMWSLAAEAAFYALLPLLMLLALARRRASSPRVWIVLATMAAVDVGWRVWIGSASQDFTGIAASMPFGYLGWFAVGIALAWVHVRGQQGDTGRLVAAVRTMGTMPGVCWALMLGLLVIASTPLAGPIALQQPSIGQDLLKHGIYAVVGGLAVLSCAFAPSSLGFARFMSRPLLRHLGHISYSLFCIHMVVLLAWSFDLARVPEFTGHGVRVWVVTLGVSLVLSELLYRFVELPGIRLKGRVGARPSPARTNTPVHATTTR